MDLEFLTYKFSLPFLKLFQFLMMSLGQEKAISLPKRQKGSYLKKMQKIKLLTNLYKVEFDENSIINIYSIKMTPEITRDATKKLTSIINSIKKELEPYTGKNFVLCGRTLYSCPLNLKPSKIAQQQSFSIKANFSESYQIEFKLVRKVEMSKINSSNVKESQLPLNFMNNLIKKCFVEMNFMEIGRSGKYFNPASKIVIPNAGLMLFNGYETSFNLLENGLYLKVDCMTKMIQGTTVLEFINSIYAKNSHLSKDEKRQIVRQEVAGRQVMTNYGNSKFWKIIDAIFDVDFDRMIICEGSNEKFTEYYQRNYGLTIVNKKQPLLKAVMNGRSAKKMSIEALLVPEFLLMSGLPDDFDERQRRQISQYTILQPQQKFNRISSLIKSFNKDSENFSPNTISESLGVKIQQNTEQIEAISLPAPSLQLGKNQQIQKNKVSNFMLFNKQLFKRDIPLNIIAFIPYDYNFIQIEKLFSSTCKNLGLIYQLKAMKINFQDSKKVLTQLEHLIIDKEGKFDDFDLSWFIIPPTFKSCYKKIKQLSSSESNPKVSQVTLTSTLSKKGFASILTKILLQIATKIGNVPWSPKISSELKQKCMMIGVDSLKDTQDSKSNAISYCCNLDQQFTKFHSNCHYETRTTNSYVKMSIILQDCLKSYGKANSALPQEIILLKNSCSESEKLQTASKEIKQIKTIIKDMVGYFPKLTYVLVNKSCNQKFFLQSKGVINPYHGTLINSKVVSNNYDFYLISQHCNRGTVKPVHYQVLYSDSGMEEGLLQQLMYVQSFNYMNWNGSIRVPSVLQYATKLSHYVGENTNRIPESQELNEYLFYI